jgi:isopentenyl diphosphate isomerase/L-lactate dehydrogenase-like FMN-dependent dehydrogenase
LVVKGIQRVDDAVLAVERGADGVVLSHHGGRQLDRVSPPLLLVPHVVNAIGSRAEVYVDSGIMSGADIVAAVAAGATGCLVGRAYLYGLMAGGEAGVDRTLEILRRDVVRTMALLGAGSVAELTPDLVSLPSC